MIRNSAIFAALLGLLLLSQEANGASRQYKTGILGITTSTNGFNGCMIKVKPVPSTLYCTNRSNHTFLTLDCDGEWVSRADAQNNLKQAQIAMLTNKQVNVVVTDSRAIEPQGYCLATQLTVLR